MGILLHAVYYEPEDVDRKKPTISVMLAINNDAILLIDIDSSWQGIRTDSFDNIDIYWFFTIIWIFYNFLH